MKAANDFYKRFRMPCVDALIKTPISVESTASVEDALELMSKHSLRKLPVLDAEQHFVGMFGLCTLLENLLPVSARMEDGLPTLDFIKGSAPGVAKRLMKTKAKKVADIMIPVADLPTVDPDSPVWEVIRMLVKHGSPLAVVDQETGVFMGLVSEQSILENLRHVIAEMEETPEEYFR